MIQLSQENCKKVLESLKKGKVDSADISFPNLIDAILLKIKKIELIEKISMWESEMQGLLEVRRFKKYTFL